MDLDGNQLDHQALSAAIRAGNPFMLLMVYRKPKDFALSTLAPGLAEMILKSVEDYEPKREINIFFRRADGTCGFFHGRFGRGGFMDAPQRSSMRPASRG